MPNGGVFKQEDDARLHIHASCSLFPCELLMCKILLFRAAGESRGGSMGKIFAMQAQGLEFGFPVSI